MQNEFVFAPKISYRDRVYIVKDLIMKLVAYGELNQTSLISFCGLNLGKHRQILDSLEKNGLIERTEKAEGRRTIAIYRPTPAGIDFCRNILEPYEKMFPRKNGKDTRTTYHDG
jgi:predicted transcriptional regulator